MAMRAPEFCEELAPKPYVNVRVANDPAWRALMNAPPLRTPLTEDEKLAIEAWKAQRVATSA